MPKLKTKKSLAKRVKFTKTGKVKRSRACGSHILTKKSRKRKRRLRRSALAHKTNMDAINKMLPYR